MSYAPSRLYEASQLLAACGWKVERQVTPTGKITFVVVDGSDNPRRSFVPVDRLYDYARGVFDAQEFPK